MGLSSTRPNSIFVCIAVLILSVASLSLFKLYGHQDGDSGSEIEQYLLSLRAESEALTEEIKVDSGALKQANARIAVLTQSVVANRAKVQLVKAKPTESQQPAEVYHATEPAEHKVLRTPVEFRVFVVSYQSDEALFKSLDALLASDLKTFSNRIYVLNNFGFLRLTLPTRFQDTVIVLDNSRRPDFSTGHLARDWNQCLIHGFQSLAKPRSKMVVCMQADNEVAPDFASTLQVLHKTYSMVNAGMGDAFTSYTAKAIEMIGVWDENFSNIGWQDYDFYLRSVLHAGSYVCFMQKTVEPYLEKALSCSTAKPVLRKMRSGSSESKKSHKASHKFHTVSERVFREKWSLPNVKAATGNWGINTAEQVKSLINLNLKPRIPWFVTYPYFENEIKNRDKIGLLGPWAEANNSQRFACERIPGGGRGKPTKN